MTSAASIVGAPSPIQSRALSLVLSSKQYRAAVVVAYGSPSFRCDIIHGTQIQKQPLSEIRLLYTNVSQYLGSWQPPIIILFGNGPEALGHASQTHSQTSTSLRPNIDPMGCRKCLMEIQPLRLIKLSCIGLHRLSESLTTGIIIMITSTASYFRDAAVKGSSGNQ